MTFKIGDRVKLKRKWMTSIEPGTKGTIIQVTQALRDKGSLKRYYIEWDTPGSHLPYSADELELCVDPSEVFQSMLK